MTLRKKFLQRVTIWLAICLLPGMLSAKQTRPDSLWYEFIVDGEKIGGITFALFEQQANGQAVMKVATETNISVRKMLVFNFSFKSNEEALIGDNGVYYYYNRMKISDEWLTMHGVLEENEFKFEISADNEKHQQSVNKGNYDYTSLDSYESALTTIGEKITLNILELDEAEVVEESLEWLRNEQIEVADTVFNCKVIEYKKPEETGTSWISDNPYGLLIRELGTDEDGSYEVRLVKAKVGAE